jgi:predicted ArsR family transcriptional regulator
MEQKRGRGRPRKYFTLEEKEAAQKRYREAFEQRTRVKSLNIYGDDLDLLRELAKRSGMSMMRYVTELVRKAKEDSDAAA